MQKVKRGFSIYFIPIFERFFDHFSKLSAPKAHRDALMLLVVTKKEKKTPVLTVPPTIYQIK